MWSIGSCPYTARGVWGSCHMWSIGSCPYTARGVWGSCHMWSLLLTTPYKNIAWHRLAADAAGIGDPAFTISVQYRTVALADWVPFPVQDLIRHRHFSFWYQVWLDARQSSILNNCRKVLKVAKLGYSVAHRLLRSLVMYGEVAHRGCSVAQQGAS